MFKVRQGSDATDRDGVDACRLSLLPHLILGLFRRWD